MSCKTLLVVMSLRSPAVLVAVIAYIGVTYAVRSMVAVTDAAQAKALIKIRAALRMIGSLVI